MTDPQIIQQYSGRNPRIDDALQRAAYQRGVRVSALYYPPGTADWDEKKSQVLLNGHTAEYLYTQHTPLTIDYVPGSRPQLERVVGRIVGPGMTEREKALAIVRYCVAGFRNDYPKPIPEKEVFLNASEEEILKLGGGQCDDRSRLIICLAQIAGLPSRFVAVYSHFRPEEDYKLVGGHAIQEIFIEGGWAFFDSSVMVFYCLRKDGRIASLWDVLSDPGIVERQPQEVLDDCGTTGERFLWYADTYLNPRSAASVSNYRASDYWRYDWHWVPITCDRDEPAYAESQKKHDRITREALAEIGITL